MAGAKLKYAWDRNGNLVSVDEVANGLACNCFCPACHCKLEAKQGEIREHHFAHYDKNECEGAIKAQLHIIAIHVLNKLRTIRLPSVTLNINGTIKSYGESIINNNLQVDEERNDNSNIPRVVVKSDSGRTLYVEVDVQHSLDTAQWDKYKKENQSAIQIQLNHEEMQNPLNSIRNKLTCDASNSRWIHNAQGEIILHPCYKSKVDKQPVDNNKLNSKDVFDNRPIEIKGLNSFLAKGLPVMRSHGEAFLMTCPRNKGKKTNIEYCQNACTSFLELTIVGEAMRIKCKDAPEFD